MILTKDKNIMDTVKSIKEHIKRVQEKIGILIKDLQERLKNHDRSKLEKELYLWEKLDLEERYPYGSKEYFEKMKRNKEVFQMHYANNRHHPEHFKNGIEDMNLIDIIEMLCDWLSYKEGNLSYHEAQEIIYNQAKRFGFGDEIINLMINTAWEYFSEFGSPEAAVPFLNGKLEN